MSATHIWSNTGFQGFPIDHVNRTVEEARDIILQSCIVEHRHDDRRIEIDQDVDVAIRSLLAASHGTEERGMGHPARAQGALVFSQPIKDILPVHAFVHTTKTARIRRGIRLSIASKAVASKAF